MKMTNKTEDEELVLIITAAGSSSRMGGIKKEYLPLNEGTVLSSSARFFLNTLNFSLVCVTYPQGAESDCKKALFADGYILQLQKNGLKFIFTPGGSSRQESVYNALKKVKEHFPASNPLVFIHDGARSFVTPGIIENTYIAAKKYGASVPGITPTDTQKEVDDEGFIKRHLTRATLSAVQTPQVFKLNQLIKAHEKAKETQKEYTDDSEIWDLFADAGKVKIVEGDIKNKKITYIQDIENLNKEKKMIRTGLGYDKHVLVSGRALMLGGVKFESNFGEDGHSDGDVLLHAITDALLGASGLGDIGSFFPPEDAKWKDASSSALLKTVWSVIISKGWHLVNIDCVILLEKPKFLPHRQKVIDSIAKILNVENSQIFVKAKTGEKLGDVGQSRAVEAFATCLLEK